MSQLLQELKAKIVATLNLSSVDPESIEDDAPLIGSGLGLDSIDILELVVMVERDYGVKIENREVGRKAFTSVRSLSDFVQESQAKA